MAEFDNIAGSKLDVCETSAVLLCKIICEGRLLNIDNRNIKKQTRPKINDSDI